MLPSSFYRPQNIQRVRYAHIAIAVTAAVFCGYLVVATLVDFHSLWLTEGLLARAKARSATLAERAQIGERQAGRLIPSSGGVELFATQVAKWAEARDVRMESLNPEGSPAAVEVKIGGTSLGQWQPNRVSVQGKGEFEQVMGLLEEFRGARMPARLEAFTLQALDSGAHGDVAFQLLLTVYEKKSEAS
jgi:hypothetical protein